MSWPYTYELEAAVEFLRSEAQSNRNDEFRVIHSLYHADGILVLCHDAGCEVIAEVAMVDGGRNRVRVDGVDVTPDPRGPLMTDDLTLTQLFTLGAVLDAIPLIRAG